MTATIKQQSTFWYKGTFATAEDSLRYHLAKHGGGRTIEQYTQDALGFFSQNRNKAQEVTLKDGTLGLLVRLGSGQPGGYFTPDGKIVSFWYK